VKTYLKPSFNRILFAAHSRYGETLEALRGSQTEKCDWKLDLAPTFNDVFQFWILVNIINYFFGYVHNPIYAPPKKTASGLIGMAKNKMVD